MLPNHAPLAIAEQFGTLATIHGDRIDLGLGRAPGGDQAVYHALRRGMQGGDRFPDDVAELMEYLGDAQPGARVKAHPGQGTHVPVWILGSSLYGAQLAAHFGLPYAFASHFAPDALEGAIAIYQALRITAVGSPETVQAQLTALIDRYQPDEVILSGQIHDHAARVRSLQIAAEVMTTINNQRAAA